jgi:hypothetical protein
MKKHYENYFLSGLENKKGEPEEQKFLTYEIYMVDKCLSIEFK